MQKTVATWGMAAMLAVGAGACRGTDDGGLEPGERLVTGRARVPEELETPSGQRLSLQAVALYAGADCSATGGVRVGTAAPGGQVSACAIFGRPFDPGLQGGGVTSEPIELVVPCALTVNVLFQWLGSSGGQTPGEPIARLGFPGGPDGGVTTLLAQEQGCRDTEKLATNVLDLGEFALPAAPPQPDEVPLVVVGGAAGGRNPLAIVDTDQDLVPNAADADDDEDGTPDPEDEDADGDGMADAAQVFDPSWLEGGPSGT